jgi:hypothetical protein
LTVRLTPSERAMIEQRAAAANMTPSGYLAELVRHGHVVVEQRQSLTGPDLAQLKRIGSNINQMTHAANTGIPPAARDVVTAMQKLMSWLLANEITRRRVEAFQAEGEAPHGSEAGQARSEFQRRVGLSAPR